MAAPRKVFRIEKLTAAQIEARTGEAPAPPHDEIVQELAALRAMLAAMPAAQRPEDPARQDEIQRLVKELRLVHSAIRGTQRARRPDGEGATAPTARIAGELEAVVEDTERATHKILAAAEDIDQAANNLAVALKGGFGHGLAQDIRDRVIQIFEACNFQDLASQRVAKVMAAVGSLEHQIARALDELTRISATPALHGPPLPSDSGHVSQSDIDSMFDGQVSSVQIRSA